MATSKSERGMRMGDRVARDFTFPAVAIIFKLEDGRVVTRRGKRMVHGDSQI